jgi:outer membrane protein OmpA-like peptidoglycan-associated protein
VDVATTRKPFTVRGGGLLMYTRDPVTLWDRLEGEEIGAVVGNRFTFMLGASVDLSDRFTLHALVPGALNGPGDAGDPKIYEAPGVGISDIGVGGRLTAIKTRDDVFALGIRAGLIFPTGTPESYLGDAGFRPHGGLLASVEVGRTLVATDIGVMGRTELLETKEDFVYGSELNWNTGFRHKLPAATRIGFTGQVLGRAGFSNFLGGGAENSLEALGGVQVYAKRNVTLDFSAGRGLTEGYATTDLRVIGGLVVEFVPKEPIVLPPPPPPPPPEPPEIIIDPPEDPPPPVWEEGELAKIVEDQIVIKDRIEFVVGTTTLLEETRPVLNAVAKIMNEEGKIAHLVIEGHASVEGSFEYNYNLSQGRARTIWQELIKAGVHPDRVSFRGMGEVVPRDEARGETEAELQDNRRVEFHIVKQYGELDERPDYPSSVKAPWSGEPIKILTPPKPAPPEPDKPNPIDEKDEFEDDTGFGEDFKIELDEDKAPTPAPEGGP